MNNISNNRNCTGCGACSYVCPAKAIEVKENENGFFKANIDFCKCVNCGMCLKVCHCFSFNETKNNTELLKILEYLKTIEYLKLLLDYNKDYICVAPLTVIDQPFIQDAFNNYKMFENVIKKYPPYIKIIINIVVIIPFDKSATPMLSNKIKQNLMPNIV